MPVTDAETGGIGVFVRGPDVSVGGGMPAGRANATVTKVGIRQGSYGGVCAAVGADVGTSDDIFDASYVRTSEGHSAS